MTQSLEKVNGLRTVIVEGIKEAVKRKGVECVRGRRTLPPRLRQGKAPSESQGQRESP